MKKPSLTIDTNCFVSLVCPLDDKTPPDELNALKLIKQWGIDSLIDIFISEKSRNEALQILENANFKEPTNQEIIEKWSKPLNILKNYDSITGIFIVGRSRIGSNEAIASTNDVTIFDNMSQLLYGKSPNDLKNDVFYDLAILFEHISNKIDIFVTRDKEHILSKKAYLKQKCNILVFNPVDAVKYLQPKLENNDIGTTEKR